MSFFLFKICLNRDEPQSKKNVVFNDVPTTDPVASKKKKANQEAGKSILNSLPQIPLNLQAQSNFYNNHFLYCMLSAIHVLFTYY